MNNIKIYLNKEGPQGLSVNWKGAYDASTTYQVNDAVYWNSSSYICIAVTTGNLPTNATYWGLMSSGMGDFSGPASSTANNFVSFANGDGKLGKDSGYNANSFEPKNANIQTHISSISNPHSVTKNQVGLGNVQNVDQTNPANITQSASYRFVTDTEKSTWNGKQDAIGYTPENVANKTSSFQATPDNTKYPTEKLVKDSLDAKEDEANKKTTITSSDTDYPTCKAVETALAGKQPTGSYEVTTNKKTTLTDSDTDYPTTKAVNTGLSAKEDVANKSTSIPTDGSSDTKYPSAKAVKDYADGLVAGLLDYRGAYDASGNVFPSTGGSGSGGAVLKGDMWIISVAGTLGGEAVQIGDSIIAKIDTPGQTTGNWDKLNANISYVPEDIANKVTSISSGSTDTQYPSAKLTYDQLALKENLTNRLSAFQGTPDNLHYITEKLAYDQLALKLNISSKATATDINTGTDDSKYITAKAIEDSFIGLNPTLYSSSVDSKGGVYNGDFEVDDIKTDSGATSSYDATKPFKGKRDLKIAFTTTVTDYVDLTNKIVMATGKVYKLSFYAQSSVAKSIKILANGTSQEIGTFTISPNQYNQYQVLVTSTGNYNNLRILANDTTASDIYIDDIKLQEVSSLTPTNTLPETMGGIFQAQNTTAIDQSLDSGGAYTNTYALTNAINEGATHRQTFTPTKTKGYSIKIWPVAKGTGNWTVVVHDASNNLISSRTIANASVVEGAFNEFIFPPLFTAGSAYHFHVYSSVADGTLKANTTDDLETGSYIQYYSKLSEGMTLVSNGIRTNLMASSKDGLLGGSILDLDNGKWKYDSGTVGTTNGELLASNVYSASSGGQVSATPPASIVINGWNTASTVLLQTKQDSTERYIIFKIDTILKPNDVKVILQTYNYSSSNKQVQFSNNGTDWSNIFELGGSSGATQENSGYFSPNSSIFYIRLYKGTFNDRAEIRKFVIEADIDTSSIPLPTIYPLAVNQFTLPIKTSTAPARAYYRLNKYVNKYGVMMPAIEFTDSSGNPLGYGCVKQDNSQEASPVLNLLSSSTGYQQSGTGSSVTGGYLLNDGEYMTLTGTNTEFDFDYQLGTGTTAISAITKNIAYLSSNSSLADSTLDASLMANFFLSVKQQGLATAIGDVREDIQEVKYELEKLNGLPYIRQILVNTATTLNETHQVVMVTGETTITLPSALGLSGRTYNIIRTGTDNVTISPVLSQTISGDASLVLTTQWDSVVIISDGANWVRCS